MNVSRRQFLEVGLVAAVALTVKDVAAQNSKVKYYCEYCGSSYSSVASLTSARCVKHPDGVSKGYHKLYEGSEKQQYVCKYCGTKNRTLRGLVHQRCTKHPKGTSKGYHAPAL
jgi:hypothetical protein